MKIISFGQKSPRNGGRRVAIIMLTSAPYKLPYLPLLDWRQEGFEWMERIGATLWGKTPRQIWDGWKANGVADLWVVRFQIISFEKVA